MAYETFGAWARDAANITVAGVTESFDEPPSRIQTAQLPVLYPRIPEVQGSVSTFSYALDLFEASLELVIVIEPVRQNTNSANYSSVLDMIDAVNESLEQNAASLGLNNWTIRQETAQIGNSIYWTLVVTLEAS